MSGDCPYYWPVSPDAYNPQKNALRVEIITSGGSCGARRKRGTDHLDAIKWIGSGGSPVTVFAACPRGGRNDPADPCPIHAAIIRELAEQEAMT